MTINTHRKRDQALARRIARVTLGGEDLPLCDVLYLDTRRGVVRLLERMQVTGKPGAWRIAVQINGRGDIQPTQCERRGRVRFWLKGATTWGMKGGKQAAKGARA